MRPARAACLLFVVLAGCTPPPGKRVVGDGPVEVVATTSIIADAVSAIVGDRVRVVALMPPGSDPHNYVPAAGDSAALANAHVVFFNGLHLEGKMGDLLEHSPSGRPAVAVTRGLAEGDVRTVDGGAADPHVWFDVNLWAKCVGVVRDELCDADPPHAETYKQNAAKYLGTLEALDKEVHEKVGRLPAEKRVLVTSHDAFGYFARAYGFTVHGLQGVSTASQVDIGQINALAKLINSKKVPAIFTETSTLTTGLEKVLEQTPGVRLVGDKDALYSDSLGAPDTSGGTYPGMVRHNVDTIIANLSRTPNP